MKAGIYLTKYDTSQIQWNFQPKKYLRMEVVELILAILSLGWPKIFEFSYEKCRGESKIQDEP